ncbi:hypothetical protein CEXT_125971, partial [Caerostris extrusa]
RRGENVPWWMCSTNNFPWDITPTTADGKKILAITIPWNIVENMENCHKKPG